MYCLSLFALQCIKSINIKELKADNVYLLIYLLTETWIRCAVFFYTVSRICVHVPHIKISYVR